MTIRESLDALQKIADIATLAGIEGTVNEELLRYETGFQLNETRSQGVYVRPGSKTFDDALVVTFLSPCLAVKRGLLSKGITKEMALELLKLNEQIIFARYGIWSTDKEDMIVASVDHLLDQLDPEEFRHHTFHVALFADRYEAQHGKDDF